MKRAITIAEGATHVDNSTYNRINAFTLAEVLITLGILGIVVAMTLPTVINKYKKQEASARLKKFYTVMNQAIMMSENDNGDLKYWDFQGTTFLNPDGSYDYNIGGESSLAFFNRYLAQYIKFYKISKGFSKEDDDGNTVSEFSKVIFHDGSSAELKKGSCQDFIFDVNGDKKPNQRAVDRFYFVICPTVSSNKFYENEKLSTYVGGKYTTREQALARCRQSRDLCTRLLQIDNWEFKDDYPYKI